MINLIPPQVKKNPFEYLALLFIFAIGLILFFTVGPNPHLRRRIIYLLTAAYFSWSLFHHYRRGDLEASIIIEYLLFGLLAVILVSTTLI